MEMAGFAGVPLSYDAIRQGNDMVRRSGAEAISAWRPTASRGLGSDSERNEYMSKIMYGPKTRDQGMAHHLAQLGPILYECAAHVTEGSFEKTDCSLQKIRKLTSIADGPLQRLSTIIVDSLAHRLLSPIQGFADALIKPSDYFEQSCLRAAWYNFANLSPYLSTGFVTINQAIMEAVEDEKVVHIVDLSCSTTHPWQWIKLLHDFRRRPEGPPELYLTVIHDDGEFLANMQALLSKEAESLEVSFHFISVIGRLETLDFSDIRSTFQIKYGAAVAISCALQMHRLLVIDDNLRSTGIAQLQQMSNFTQIKQMASSVCSPSSTLNYIHYIQTPSPPCHVPKLLARLLSAIRSLKPNIMVIMEQDASHNTLLFHDRFVEVLNYYAALFDSFHAAAAANPRSTDERLRVERMILGEEIKNILVCEGVHRHERHERLDQWAMYMGGSGFDNVPLSFSAIREGKEKLLSFGLKNCQSKEDRCCLLLCWGSTNLYSISAWRPNMGSPSLIREHMLQLRLCCTNRSMFQDDMLSSATSSPASSSVFSPSFSPSNGSWVQELSHDHQSVRLISLLYQCSAEVAAGSFDRANLCLEHITQLSSLDAPHALQRLAAVFADALARKLLNLVPGLSRALLSSSAANSAESHLVTAARRHMFDALPFLKLAYLTTNHAILEAMEGERFVHVVDFSGPAANPVQWIALFHAFRGRREGPPHLRITAVHESKDFLANMAAVLSKEAEAFDIAFQFNAVEASLDEMDDFDALHRVLGVRSGEALAVSVVLQLHRLLATADDNNGGARRHALTPLQIIARSSPRSFGELLERELNTRLQLSPDTPPHSPLATSTTAPKLGSFLSSVRSLSPKIMVVTEQEASHNGVAFNERFDEALNYYASLFDCLQRSSALSPAERGRVERVLLGEEIRGVVAREGKERRERHERARQWAARMEAAGMERVGISYSAALEAGKLLQSCGWAGPYEVRHDAAGHGFFFFCWHKKPLYAVSSWRPAASMSCCRHTRS
uniref:GRAS family transcription factor n=1 Tax=Leersia perrieri TaxID=77586 RepID=A0A0D9XWR9_9ORYZ